MKLPLVIALMAAMAWLAWGTQYVVLRWSAYVGIGYLWMSIVTFMHDAAHNTLFRSKRGNWIFGIIAMVPIFATFVAFKLDHLEHHRHNRSARDPDAFTMGRRRPLDFVVFYAYAVAGALLSFVHFNALYPIKHFNREQWLLHVFELALKAAAYSAVISYALAYDVLGRTLELWLAPLGVFSLLNSMRFIAEHYGTPWDQGQMLGTRTVRSNAVNAYFWNNINWHIGHHLYPGVPWYNLVELHKLLAPSVEAAGAVVDRSYIEVYLKALLQGPESETQLKAALATRAQSRQR